jgi:hypothetical protein
MRCVNNHTNRVRYFFFSGLSVAGLAMLFIFSAATALAQTASAGSVTGLVTDAQGAIVPGAEVTLLDTATKNKLTTTTNSAGRYDFPVVSPGVYEITVSKQGFKVAKLVQQQVNVGLVLTANVTLEVGSVSETVVVTTQSMELQTANATIGNTISLTQLELLPNLGRDATTLIALQPGVAAANSAGQAGGSVAGAYNDQNTFTIDGGNNTDDMSGTTTGYEVNFTGTSGSQTNGFVSGVVPTPIESVEEFKVNTFGQTADFNNSSGAQVQMVTRRGTDQWHGSGYGYYYATNHLGANSWANNHTPFNKGIVPPSRPACAPGTTYSSGDNNCVLPYTPLIPNHRSRFGFSVGGPATDIKIGGQKTYFFVNYEGFRFPNATTFERNYPTAAFRAGVIQVPDANGVYQPYNLNPFPVTVTVGSAAKGDVRTCTLPAYGTATGVNCANPTANVVVDPRGIGMSPVVNTIWNKYLPLPNDPLSGDQYNTQGYLSTIRLPLTSDSYVGRIDHDFGSKHRFFTTYRTYRLTNFTSNQVDVGGLLNGGTVGTYVATAPRPQNGSLLVFGLTSTLSPTITNDVRLSYLRNWWQWSTAGDPPQLPGLGGAIEIAPGNTTNAEQTTALIPYNVNTQNTRQRIWDGQDKMIRDDLTWVKGNHLFQFGGSFQRNFDYHTRTDNGSTVNNQIVYLISASGISFSGFLPSTNYVPTSQQALYQRLASEVYGLVAQTQVIYTRTGSNLTIQPIGTTATQISTIKYYNGYFSDTWRLKPSLTLNYGLGYAVEMPPVEKNGAQVALVYQDGTLVNTADFLAKRKAAALAGQAYAPVIGFETTGNLHLKYPYNPFYGGLSPRIAVAWNPSYHEGLLGKLFGGNQTVIRGGYGRIYGRLNGVNQVLVPLLGPGLLQGVTCSLVASNGTCLTSGSVSLANVFRIGPDGLTPPLAAPTTTLPQPFLPGIAGACPGANSTGTCPVAPDTTSLDPNFRPEKTDNFNFTIQRSFGSKVAIEVGYMGRRIRNVYQQVNLDSVPYMTTLGGQTFADAYAKMYINICGLGTLCANNPYTGGPQPFFEAALGGPNSAYCTGYASCTAALAAQSIVTGATGFIPTTAVSELWAYLNNTGTSRANGTLGSWVLGKTMLSSQANSINMITSLGYANYNAGFMTLQIRDWHGVTAISNFTFGRALGTGELAQYNSSNTLLDPFNPSASYGPQNFDSKVIFNVGLSYQPKSFLGFYDFSGKHGIVGKLLNGWTVAPFFTYQSGLPIGITYAEGSANCTGCESFGSTGRATASSTSVATLNAVLIGTYTGGNSAHFNILPSSGVGSNNPTGINLFADPNAVFNEFRRCILGYDTSCGGYGNLRGLPKWNVDMAITKETKFAERIGLSLSLQITNLFNHFQPQDPSFTSINNLSLTSPSTFGRITAAVFAPRQVEVGAKIRF